MPKAPLAVGKEPLNLQASSVHSKLRELLLEDESRVFERTYKRRRGNNPQLPPSLDFEQLRQGKLQYEELAGYESPGLKIISHTRESETKLKTLKGLRKGAATVSVGTSLVSTLYLAYAGLKKLFSSTGFGDDESANKHIGNAFSLGAVAGIANGASQENLNWGIGSAGMGYLGRHLDKPWGLALFSIFDGLNAMGMGEVSRRDNKNANEVGDSIFNNPKLSALKFLTPYEGAVKSFWKRFTSVQGWKKTFSDEPYALFQSAGGGLISGGVLLGALSLFTNKMSEGFKSLLYLPYSLTSMVNLIALGRDGAVIKERAHLMNGRKKSETKLMDVEGWSKLAAAPVIALNYGLLALKGLGLNGATEGIAMSLRSWGVGIANLAFAAKSAANLVVTDRTGPLTKEIIKIILNPQIIMQQFIDLVKQITDERGIQSKPAGDFIMGIIKNDRFSDLLLSALNTQRMKKLINRPLTGLPSRLAEERYETSRGVHSLEAAAGGCILFDRSKANNPDIPEYQDENYEAAFKLACLLHDNGHSDFARCHHVEGAVPGVDNDHQSIYGLARGTELYNAIENWYIGKLGKVEGEKRAEKVIKLAIDIIALEQDEYKPADILAYSKAPGSDYNLSFDLPAWGLEEYQYFADQRVLYKDDEGKLRVGWTEEGAVMLFDQLYDRLVFNASLNYHPFIAATEQAPKIGIENSNLTKEQVFKMDVGEFDQAAQNGTGKVTGKTKQVIRIKLGGEDSKTYCGYSPKWYITVVKKDRNGTVVYKNDFLRHLEEKIRYSDRGLYDSLKHKATILTTPALIELELEINTEFDNTAKFQAKESSAVLFPHKPKQYATERAVASY